MKKDISTGKKCLYFIYILSMGEVVSISCIVALSFSQFQTVADMLSMRSLPKVVKATKTHSTSSAETSVSEGELLVVKSTKSKLTGRFYRQ